jgi:hypothetical protein
VGTEASKELQRSLDLSLFLSPLLVVLSLRLLWCSSLARVLDTNVPEEVTISSFMVSTLRLIDDITATLVSTRSIAESNVATLNDLCWVHQVIHFVLFHHFFAVHILFVFFVTVLDVHLDVAPLRRYIVIIIFIVIVIIVVIIVVLIFSFLLILVHLCVIVLTHMWKLIASLITKFNIFD